MQAHIYELRQRFQGRKVMLGVDRLDMIKGIPQKLLGFEKFLSEHPEWRDRVLLARNAVHSRPFASIRVHSRPFNSHTTAPHARVSTHPLPLPSLVPRYQVLFFLKEKHVCFYTSCVEASTRASKKKNEKKKQAACVSE